MIRRALSAAVLLLVIATSSVALAGDAALAEALFRQGRELMEQGDYAAACPKLSESFEQDPATGTLLALAMCQEQAGQTASAWATYAQVVSRAKRDGRTDREESARQSLQALEPKLSRLTIEVDAAAASLPGLVVKRDGQAVGRGAWGAPSPVDPGEHVVEATAPGKQPWKGTVTLGATADSQVVRVPALEGEAASPVTTPTPPPPSASEPRASGDSVAEDTGPTPSGPPLRTIGIVVGGAGVVALGVGGYFALKAKSLNTESNSNGHCDANNECDAVGLGKRDDAVSAAKGATIAFVAGGVLAAAGVTLFIVGGSQESKPTTARLEATPAVGPGVGALLVRGRF